MKSNKIENIFKLPNVFSATIGIAVGLIIQTVLFFLIGEEGYYFICLTALALNPIALFILFGPFAICIALSKLVTKKHKTKYMNWKSVVVIIFIGWPLCVFGPVFVRLGYLNYVSYNVSYDINQFVTHELPIYPGAKIEIRNGNESENSKPTHHIILNSTATPLEIMRFYEHNLETNGWATVPPNLVSVPILGTPYKFARKRVTLSITVNNINEQERSIEITIY